MTAQQIIDDCISEESTAEEIIIKHDFGTAKMARHFNLDPRLSTAALKYTIVDKIQAIVDSEHKPQGEHTEATTTF